MNYADVREKAAEARKNDNRFEPLPAGEYDVIIKNAEEKATKNGSGRYLSMTYEVADGPMAKRLIFENINFKNQNPICENIGLAALDELTEACGLTNRKDFTEIDYIGMEIFVSVGIEQAHDGFDARNRVNRRRSAKVETAPVFPVAEKSPADFSDGFDDDDKAPF